MSPAKQILLGALIGCILGAAWGVISYTHLSRPEDLNWRCIEFSPVNGKCVLLEHKDRIHE